jgi:hypothetical protein
MPLLKNQRHELFAQQIAKGLSATQAYVKAGYSEQGAAQSADRLLRNADLKARIAEIQAELYAATKRALITERESRIRAYQDRWERMTRVITERAADPKMKGVPGGTTGLLCHTFKMVGSGPAAMLVDEYEVDTGLLREARAHEEQAAKELGQWTEKRELSGTLRFEDLDREALEQLVRDAKLKYGDGVIQ